MNRIAMEKDLIFCKDDWIGTTYLWLRGHSNQIWDTVEKADREYKRQKTEAAKLYAW